MLRLAIGLRVESGGFVTVDIAKFKKIHGELGSELGISVHDNVIQKAVILEYMLQIQAGSLFGIDLSRGGTEVRYLGELIHTNKDGIAISRPQKLNDEVH